MSREFFNGALPMNEIAIDVCGPYALFTDPTFRSERYSLSCITPSACVGLLKSIYWHPSCEYECVKIQVLNKIQRTSVTVNELNAPISGTSFARAVKNDESGFFGVSPYETRQQKCNTFLVDVNYRIILRILPARKPTEEPFDLKKVKAILERRLNKGQFYHIPCLGVSECLATVRMSDQSKEVRSYYEGRTIQLGTMPSYIDYIEDENGGLVDVQPHFYRPIMVDGIIETPSRKEVTA